MFYSLFFLLELYCIVLRQINIIVITITVSSIQRRMIKYSYVKDKKEISKNKEKCIKR